MAIQLRITKEGFNALTESDPKNYIFDASLNHLKTVASGETDTTLSASGATVLSVLHGLGYKPLAIAYFRTTDNPDRWSICMADTGTVAPFRKSMNANVGLLVDDTSLFFFVRNKSGATRTIEIQFEIFYEGDT